MAQKQQQQRLRFQDKKIKDPSTNNKRTRKTNSPSGLDNNKILGIIRIDIQHKRQYNTTHA